MLENNIKSFNAAMIKKNSEEEEYLELKSKKEEGAKFVLLLGHPIKEPVAKYGPFVMNDFGQLEDTFDDFRSGKNGFEGANEWESKIKDMKNSKH